MKRFFRSWLAGIVILAFMSVAQAQYLVTVPGYMASGTPPSGLTGMNYQMNCSTSTLTTGTICEPVYQLGNALPIGTQLENNSYPTTSPLTTRSTDPCFLGGGVGNPVNKITETFYIPASTAVTQLVGVVANTQTYACAIDVAPYGADNFSLWGGTGSLCSVATNAVVGSVTAGQGIPYPASAPPWSRGTGGASVYRTSVSGNGLCFSHNAATAVSLTLTYVQQ
jgi:hypothetical protein